ncbi:MAG TPA: glycosyltransferase family 9 protein, partial [Phenylobacterium sp.]|nr:glycosyltransferase family 9 protein [Phenylobacterium sp.]
GFKVGFKTQGNAAHGNDANRSLPAGLAEVLRGTAERSFGLDPQESGAADFADTAAILAALDLVVSVDTSAAHLAGAMGKPCWVLLPAADTDWRWLRGRSDSPWYPSMRLYRQAPGAGWAPVIARVARDLQRLG